MTGSFDRRDFLKLGGAAAALAAAGCATTAGGAKARVVVIGGGFGGATAAKYLRMWSDYSFDVTLVEGNRRFQGEGALSYRARPLAARGDVFGPQSTPVLRFALFGDTLTVVLPREGEILRGLLGDPRFAELTGERALVTPEVLGALLGAYDVRRLMERSDRVASATHDDLRTLYIWETGALHALTVRAGRLVEYRQATGGELAYRVKFEEFAPVDGRESPRRVVVRDFARDRWLVLEVSREHEEVEDAAFLPLP